MTPNCIAPGCMAPRTAGSSFCILHGRDPAGTRGGWVSAEKRRQLRSAGKDPLDASNIVRRLWVGSRPPFDRDLPEFDVLVLCAEEIQPERIAFSRRVVRVPLPDSDLTDVQVRIALDGGRSVASELASGKRLLVTCRAGINRSALVASLGLGLVTTMSADELTKLMRARRNPVCLSNPFFGKVLARYIGAGRRAR